MRITTYCGASWWRLSDWRVYGLFRNLRPGAFSIGPILVYKR